MVIFDGVLHGGPTKTRRSSNQRDAAGLRGAQRGVLQPALHRRPAAGRGAAAVRRGGAAALHLQLLGRHVALRVGGAGPQGSTSVAETRGGGVAGRGGWAGWLGGVGGGLAFSHLLEFSGWFPI